MSLISKPCLWEQHHTFLWFWFFHFLQSDPSEAHMLHQLSDYSLEHSYYCWLLQVLGGTLQTPMFCHFEYSQHWNHSKALWSCMTWSSMLDSCCPWFDRFEQIVLALSFGSWVSCAQSKLASRFCLMDSSISYHCQLQSLRLFLELLISLFASQEFFHWSSLAHCWLLYFVP